MTQWIVESNHSSLHLSIGERLLSAIQCVTLCIYLFKVVVTTLYCSSVKIWTLKLKAITNVQKHSALAALASIVSHSQRCVGRHNIQQNARVRVYQEPMAGYAAIKKLSIVIFWSNSILTTLNHILGLSLSLCILPACCWTFCPTESPASPFCFLGVDMFLHHIFGPLGKRDWYS